MARPPLSRTRQSIFYFLNSQAKRHAVITVTADTDDFWSRGVEIQPWRLNIRPRRTGRTIAFALTFEGDLDVPADGGYSFLLIANEQASLSIDGARMAENLAPIAQVCGMPGFAARFLRATAPLSKGRHHVQVVESHSEGEDNFRFLWRGPGILLQPVPAARWTHNATHSATHSATQGATQGATQSSTQSSTPDL